MVHRWDLKEIRSVRVSMSRLAELKPAVRKAFDVPDDKVCMIYYLDDPERPKETNVKLDKAENWRSFWNLRSLRIRGQMGLHLHVTPHPAPGQPDKEPRWLRIDTGLANRGNQRRGGTPSSAVAGEATPSAGPTDVQSPLNVNILLRRGTLQRDFDQEKQLSYCVFCSQRLPVH